MMPSSVPTISGSGVSSRMTVSLAMYGTKAGGGFFTDELSGEQAPAEAFSYFEC